jgi:hypothetical protein
MCSSLTFLSHSNNTFFFFLSISFDKFQHENYVGMWGHYGSRIVEVFSRPLMRCQARLPIFFGGIGLLFMEDCASSTFLGSWDLVALDLCSRFRIFNRPVLEGYVSQVERGSHLL